MRNTRRTNPFKDDDADPLSVVVNLFDVAMVFSVALMVSMVMNLNLSAFFTGGDFTIVNKNGDDMEIIQKKGEKITKYKTAKGASSSSSSKDKGKRLGTLYENEDGENILSQTNLSKAYVITVTQGIFPYLSLCFSS